MEVDGNTSPLTWQCESAHGRKNFRWDSHDGSADDSNDDPRGGGADSADSLGGHKLLRENDGSSSFTSRLSFRAAAGRPASYSDGDPHSGEPLIKRCVSGQFGQNKTPGSPIGALDQRKRSRSFDESLEYRSYMVQRQPPDRSKVSESQSLNVPSQSPAKERPPSDNESGGTSLLPTSGTPGCIELENRANNNSEQTTEALRVGRRFGRRVPRPWVTSPETCQSPFLVMWRKEVQELHYLLKIAPPELGVAIARDYVRGFLSAEHLDDIPQLQRRFISKPVAAARPAIMPRSTETLVKQQPPIQSSQPAQSESSSATVQTNAFPDLESNVKPTTPPKLLKPKSGTPTKAELENALQFIIACDFLPNVDDYWKSSVSPLIDRSDFVFLVSRIGRRPFPVDVAERYWRRLTFRYHQDNPLSVFEPLEGSVAPALPFDFLCKALTAFPDESVKVPRSCCACFRRVPVERSSSLPEAATEGPSGSAETGRADPTCPAELTGSKSPKRRAGSARHRNRSSQQSYSAKIFVGPESHDSVACPICLARPVVGQPCRYRLANVH